MSIRVLIADDHPVVRDGLRFSLERGGRDVVVVGEAADGIEVLELAKICRVDVFILDITMPRLNGTGHGARIAQETTHSPDHHPESARLARHGRSGPANRRPGLSDQETASSNVTEAVCEAYAGHFCLSRRSPILWSRGENSAAG